RQAYASVRPQQAPDEQGQRRDGHPTGYPIDIQQQACTECRDSPHEAATRSFGSSPPKSSTPYPMSLHGSAGSSSSRRARGRGLRHCAGCLLEAEQGQRREALMSMLRTAIGLEGFVGKQEPVTLATSFGVHDPAGELLQLRFQWQPAKGTE